MEGTKARLHGNQDRNRGMRMMENEGKHKTPGEKASRRRLNFGRPARQPQ